MALLPNVLYSREVTPAGMVIDVRALVSANACSPMDVSWLPDAKVTEVRALVP